MSEGTEDMDGMEGDLTGLYYLVRDSNSCGTFASGIFLALFLLYNLVSRQRTHKACGWPRLAGEIDEEILDL